MEPVARIVSAEGQIAVRPVSNALALTISVGTQAEICAGETIQAGRRSRAAVLLLASNQIIRLDQNTSIRIVAQTPAQPRALIDLVQGFIRLFNPVGRALDIRTPYVTAGTEGTEFYVSFDPQNEDTVTAVIDGIVRVTSGTDMLRLGPGEAVRVPRMGPAQRLNIRPNDAVRWTIYYPPAIWNLPPQEEAALDPRVARAWQAWRSGDFAGLTAALETIPPQAPLDARSALRFAALLLTLGQVDEAAQAITRAEQSQPQSPLIPALRAVIAVAQNQTDEALTLSERAVAAAGTGDPAAVAAAAMARSYALQSAFRLPEAQQVLAPLEALNDPLILGRLAELSLSLGNGTTARRQAQRATELAPSLSLAWSILGFSSLANYEISSAQSAFEKAAALSPGDPLPHLGLGLVHIRQRDLADGRSEMAIAVGLDPESAIARSYLGKTYATLGLYDASLREGALREWALAEMSDPKDPTAPLYRAFAERSLNRPVEALTDIQRSIALNDNRAVYRSRLLLDQDLATRTTDLASVYRDLGFDQLALSEAYNSIGANPANPSAHRFLSDTYLTLPRHEAASDSELLQSLLLQPLNVQPLRPRLAREGLGILDLQGPFRVGYNEFNPLFASNGLNLLGDAFGGNRGTYGENLVLSGIYNNLSFSAGQFYYRTEGIRPNNDLRRNIEDVLVQGAISDRASILVEYRNSEFQGGDTSLLFDPNNFLSGYRRGGTRVHYRVGGRFDLAPALTIIGHWTHERVTTQSDLQDVYQTNAKINGDSGEAAIFATEEMFDVVAGGGYLDSREILMADSSSVHFEDNQNTNHFNGWVYTNIRPIRRLSVTLGASYDADRGLFDRDKFSPKVGLLWNLFSGSTLRAAYFEGLKRDTAGGQTIEPTQVAGFNQFFDDDFPFTKARRWGVGFDQAITDRLIVGFEWAHRSLKVPAILDFEPPVTIVESYWNEEAARGYVNWSIGERFAVNFGPQWEKLGRTDPYNVGQLTDLKLARLPIEIRYFDPLGMYAWLRTTFVFERGHFLDSSATLFSGDENFTVFDAGIGWRVPGRGIVGSVQIKNLLNSGFKFQDTDPDNPAFVPHRLILGRITFAL